jgi:hypothetical protein
VISGRDTFHVLYKPLAFVHCQILCVS